MKKLLFVNAAAPFLLCCTSSSLQAQCSGFNVPYFEDFSSITVNNQLPLCWLASSPGNATLTYTNTPGHANNYAAFYHLPTGTNHFFSPAINLMAGETYSVSAWYKTGNTGGQNWTNLSLMLGTGQTSTGLVAIVSANNPVASQVYIPISGTFVVASSGQYYIAVEATGTSTGSSPYLYWDELGVIAPCDNSPNKPVVTIAANSTTVCSNELSAVTLTASGADTYTWESGAQTATLQPSAPFNQVLKVTGTDTASGCRATADFTLTVHPAPAPSVIGNPPSLCQGKNATLQAFGASSYSWSHGPTSPSISVSPSTSTTYTVTGMNSFGCKEKATLYLQVLALPDLVMIQSADTVCENDPVDLSVTGGISYTWTVSGSTHSGAAITVTPQVNTTFTLTGIDENGCENQVNGTIYAIICTSLPDKHSLKKNLLVFPNPCAEVLQLHGLPDDAVIEIYDLLGKRQDVTFHRSGNESVSLQMDTFPEGTYLIYVSSGTELSRLIVLKHN